MSPLTHSPCGFKVSVRAAQGECALTRCCDFRTEPCIQKKVTSHRKANTFSKSLQLAISRSLSSTQDLLIRQPRGTPCMHLTSGACRRKRLECVLELWPSEPLVYKAVVNFRASISGVFQLKFDFG